MIQKRTEDGKYEITPQGREEVEWPFRMLHSGPRSVEGTVEEVSSYIAYLEDLSLTKDQRLAENKDKIKELADRLAKVSNS